MSEKEPVRNVKLKLPAQTPLSYTGSNERVQELFRASREDGEEGELMLSPEEAEEYFANVRRQDGMSLFPGESAKRAVELATRPPSEEEKAQAGEQ